MVNHANLITIGITTNYGGKQLIKAIESMRKADGGDVPIILVSDGVEYSEKMLKQLEDLEVVFIQNDDFTSAFAKQQQILDLVKTKYVLITQDDVIFEKDTITNIVDALQKDPEITFLGVRNVGLEPQNIIEAALNVGTRLNNTIARLWNNGDNYLAILGRVMVLDTNWLRNMIIDPESVSLDAHMYLENKRLNGKYECLWGTNIYFRNPQNIKEHMRKSSRFQNSLYEMQKYTRFYNLDLKKEYSMPLKAIIRAGVQELFRDPLSLTAYAFVFAYTRIFKQQPEVCLTANWEVDLSTKNI